MRARLLIALLFLGLLLPGTALAIFGFGDVDYRVVFEKAPVLASPVIVSQGVEIGSVADKELRGDNRLILNIGIKSKYKELIRANGAFVVVDGLLEYRTIGEPGTPLPEDGVLPGFTDETSYRLFQAKTAMGSAADSLRRMVDDLMR